jgi:DNA polymerase-3 subunit epsilon
MREIVIDTETTGLDAEQGHRLVEIGAVELMHHVPTGRNYHQYINPQRDVPPDAFSVHGLSENFLRDKPVFGSIIDDLLNFLGDAKLICHNAAFDVTFLNLEMRSLGRAPFHPDRIVDSLLLARRKHPLAANSLDALCKRYGIDNSRRQKHGALLDAELLAEVYIELIGGKQPALTLSTALTAASPVLPRTTVIGPRPQALPSRITEAELAAHRILIETLGPRAVWRLYA